MSDLFLQTGAVLSECGRFRYRLSRVWNANIPPAVFICLNPSTADAEADDPTIRRCVGFAKTFQCGGIVVVNLFALRATDPRELKKASDPVGPDNDSYIRHAVSWGSPIIAAWGACQQHMPRAHNDRIAAVLKLLSDFDLYCLGKTKDGHPRHPLMLANSAKLTLFREHFQEGK